MIRRSDAQFVGFLHEHYPPASNDQCYCLELVEMKEIQRWKKKRSWTVETVRFGGKRIQAKEKSFFTFIITSTRRGRGRIVKEEFNNKLKPAIR